MNSWDLGYHFYSVADHSLFHKITHLTAALSPQVLRTCSSSVSLLPCPKQQCKVSVGIMRQQGIVEYNFTQKAPNNFHISLQTNQLVKTKKSLSKK